MRYVFIATKFSPDFLPIIQKSTSPTDDVLFLDFYTAQQKKFEKVQNIKIEHVDIKKYNHVLYEEECMDHFFSKPNKRVSILKPYFPHALRCRLSASPFHMQRKIQSIIWPEFYLPILKKHFSTKLSYVFYTMLTISSLRPSAWAALAWKLFSTFCNQLFFLKKNTQKEVVNKIFFQRCQYYTPDKIIILDKYFSSLLSKLEKERTWDISVREI